MHKKTGFSLVELSIVLVILGLLTGGILAGQSLIRASELRSVGTQYNNYITAVNTFRDKYFAIPGDFNKAQDVWTTLDNTPATCRTTPATGTATCNGNGDGIINSGGGISDEYFRFWQHLANAGLIEGSYTGTRDGSTATSATTRNSPASKLGGIWYVSNYGTQSGGTVASVVFDGNYGNSMEMAKAVANDIPYTPIVKPEDLWNLDSKIDDGKPATGKLVVRCQSGLAGCTNAAGATSYTADYLLTQTSNTAAYLFRTLF